MALAVRSRVEKFAVAAVPLAMPPAATWEEPVTRHPVRDIAKDKPVVVDIVEKSVKPAPVTEPVRQQTVAPAHSQANNVAVISETGSEHVIESTTAVEAGIFADPGTALSAAPTAVQEAINDAVFCRIMSK